MKAITLFELNRLIKELIEDSFTQRYWITAELSEVRVSAAGHCFLELVEKSPNTSAPKAKVRAVVMNYVWPVLRMTFEQATGQNFRAGLKVQIEVEISFSEIYGYSLIVKDIDPTYTIGSLAQLRQEILSHLQSDGIIEMNRSLRLARPLQRIAVISSATAAGYGDFCNQLDHNAQSFRFVHRLFAATMQGETTAPSIIQSLDKIMQEAELWDCVVIIRGGGAVSDLAGFENYELAASIAQYPLPVIVGIGHERDKTVLDFIAHTSLKTPTAVAAFLIERMEGEAQIFERYQRACQRVLGQINAEKLRLQRAQQIGQQMLRLIESKRTQLTALQRALNLYDPKKILKLGYSITRQNGRILRSERDLKPGEILQTTLYDGTILSQVVCPSSGSDEKENG